MFYVYITPAVYRCLNILHLNSYVQEYINQSLEMLRQTDRQTVYSDVYIQYIVLTQIV